jgi:cell division protein FtsL
MRRESSAWPDPPVRDARGRSRVLLRERIERERQEREPRPPQRPASGRLGLLYPLLLFALAVAATALIIDNRTRLVGGSYEIDALRSRAEELRTRNRQLRLEISALTEPADVDAVAAKLGLRTPTANQVRPLPSPPERGAGVEGRTDR